MIPSADPSSATSPLRSGASLDLRPGSTSRSPKPASPSIFRPVAMPLASSPTLPSTRSVAEPRPVGGKTSFNTQ